MKPVRIAQRSIGDGRPCFVIAEVGVNHNGDLDLAHRPIDLSVEALADAVKFQSFREDLARAMARIPMHQPHQLPGLVVDVGVESSRIMRAGRCPAELA